MKVWLRRAVTLAALAGAVVVWNVVFDAHILAGTQTYLSRQAESPDAAAPGMAEVMAAARHDGVRAATARASIVIVAGVFLRIALGRPQTRRQT